jgi:hypothetical protein
MKTHITLRPALLAAAFILHPSSFILAQGSLTPPGAPAPTMKTLDQLEARTPISTAPFTIGTSGSYYLTGNLSVTTGNAIVINADNVTLDLNGFTLSSTAATDIGSGVSITNVRTNVVVRNGSIRGLTTYSAGTFTKAGFQSGIFVNTSTSQNIRVADIHVSGVGNNGILLPTGTMPSSMAERCMVLVCSQLGLSAGAVRDCVVKTAGTNGIFGLSVSSSSGETVGTGVNDHGISGTTVESCLGTAVGGYGVNAETVSNSRGTSVGGRGIVAIDATNCRASSTTGIGLFATTATGCFGQSTDEAGLAANTATNCWGQTTNGTGISATTATNSRGSSSSGTGLSATVAMNCYGQSGSGVGIASPNASNCNGFSSTGPAGIDANPGTASFCRGSRLGGIAINAGIAIGCTVSTGTVNSLSKHLGTP